MQYRGANDDLGGALDGVVLDNFTIYITGETPAGFDLQAEKTN